MSKYSANGFQGNTMVQHQRGGTMAKAVWGHVDIEALANACEPPTHRIGVSDEDSGNSPLSITEIPQVRTAVG